MHSDSLPPSVTPCCGRLVDAATHIDFDGLGDESVRPEANNISVCAHCGEWLAYIDNSNHLRLMTPSERRNLTAERRAQMLKATAWIKHHHALQLQPGHGKATGK